MSPLIPARAGPPSVARRPAPAPAGLRGRLLATALLAALPRPGHAQGMAEPAPAQGMALLPPAAGLANGAPAPPREPSRAPPRLVPEEVPPVQARPQRRPPHGSGGPAASADGPLPNQRTGRRHEHVVRDICIGC